jgi:hypothetical protein
MIDHAHELRRYSRKIAHPAGDVPAVMLAAADEIERLQSVIAGLRADFETAHARMMTSAAAERDARAALVEKNADICGPETMLCDVLRGNAAAIRARGEPDAP